MNKKSLLGVAAASAAIAFVILILYLLGADPIAFALRSRYAFLNFAFLIVIIGALLWMAAKIAGKRLSNAYSREPRLIQKHLQEATRQVEGASPAIAQERSQSWESMPDAQKELFISTYLEDRYRGKVPPNLSPSDRELLGKAYWYSLGSEQKAKAQNP
jgi:hypothetical protein